MILEFFSLSVFANLTSYFSLSLVFILWFLLFSGNRSASLLYFMPCFANFSHKTSLLDFRESKEKREKEVYYGDIVQTQNYSDNTTEPAQKFTTFKMIFTEC